MKPKPPYRPKGRWYEVAFAYLEPLWTGNDGKISLRSVLGITFCIHLMKSITFMIKTGFSGDLSLVIGIEGGLIVAFFALKAYQNTVETKVAAKTDPPPEPLGD